MRFCIFTAASSQTKRVWLQFFCGQVQGKIEISISKSALLHLDVDHPRMCFVSRIEGPFHEQIKNEAKTNDHYLKKPNISVRIFAPTELGTCLARIWKSNTDQQKSKIPFGHVFFHQLQLSFCVFGEPWKSKKLRWQFRCWWFLGLKTVKRNVERGSKTHEKNTTCRFEANKNGVENSVEQSPLRAVKTFHESMTLYLEDHPI